VVAIRLSPVCSIWMRGYLLPGCCWVLFLCYNLSNFLRQLVVEYCTSSSGNGFSSWPLLVGYFCSSASFVVAIRLSPVCSIWMRGYLLPGCCWVLFLCYKHLVNLPSVRCSAPGNKEPGNRISGARFPSSALKSQVSPA
jgi:hypothetical protein